MRNATLQRPGHLLWVAASGFHVFTKYGSVCTMSEGRPPISADGQVILRLRRRGLTYAEACEVILGSQLRILQRDYRKVTAYGRSGDKIVRVEYRVYPEGTIEILDAQLVSAETLVRLMEAAGQGDNP